jgi:hypothetical protein
LSAPEATEREEHTAPAAMVLAARPDPGVYALAAMPEADFAQRLELYKTARRRVQMVQRALMTEGVHYGVVPGTDKPTMFKSGSEVLCNSFGLVTTYDLSVQYGDGKTAPPISVTVKALQHLGDSAGPVVAEGVGAANSWERRYRYRTAQLSCPKCGQETVLKSKHDPGFFCWAKRGGCGAQFGPDDPAITEQPRGQVENPDQFDLLNTLLKMAKKRAKVDATLEATATSDLFTQDLEEGLPPEEGAPAAEEPRKVTPSSSKAPTRKDRLAARRQAWGAACEVGGLPDNRDTVVTARDWLMAVFGVELEKESDELFDVVTDYLRGGFDLPPDHLANDIVSPDEIRVPLQRWLDKRYPAATGDDEGSQESSWRRRAELVL